VAETIFALSSGIPPAAIAVVRISGPQAAHALQALAGRLPQPRRASSATLIHPLTGEELDRALILHLPGPATATGEDVAELHLHGGRAVIAGVTAALATVDGLRPALPGEFTRRAYENGRIDLAEAEGLADLLAAETDSQRRAAMGLAGGALSRQVEYWQGRLLALGALLEAEIDHSDEDDVRAMGEPDWRNAVGDVALQVNNLVSNVPVERLKEGLRVVIAGPPNAGKSTLLNALAGRDAAITSAIAGTTRDAVEAPTAIGGSPFLLIDTAGLRESGDEIETIGINRARAQLATADLVLWLGDPEKSPQTTNVLVVQAKADVRAADPAADLRVSAKTGEGMEQLLQRLIEHSRELLPREGDIAVNARHRVALSECLAHLEEAQRAADILVAAESLRQARVALDRVTGRAGVEDMLDALFGRFCIGK
jgi:tRNA modification GTPase